MKYPEWIIHEAFRRSGWTSYSVFESSVKSQGIFQSLVEACAELAAAGLIREPVSPELRAAREQYAAFNTSSSTAILRGDHDKSRSIRNRLATIEKYKELLNAEA